MSKKNAEEELARLHAEQMDELRQRRYDPDS
jgi:hypothetical protein